MVEKVVEVQDLHFGYGKLPIFSGLSLDIRRGQVVAILGATPVFVDVDEATFNIDPASLENGIAVAKKALTAAAADPLQVLAAVVMVAAPAPAARVTV